ncbi:MAG: flagellar assembly peptidoglycan hydrolase FlgJ [Gammaproteobacteria bacterium]|nr:MAG: flagellar assembly peptidoglycan hydrolase FlgJ [Gammaproteobacteria bacterium]
MISRPEMMASLVADPKGVGELKRAARQNSPQALRDVARQFEGLFLQMVLKSMRDASLSEDLMSSDQGRMYQDMLDQQISQTLSKQGTLGFADLLIKQLAGTVGESASEEVLKGLNASLRPRVQIPDANISASQQQFVKTLWPHAQRAAARLGVQPQALLAQAALETGWGHHVSKDSNGLSSHNLFGIKASSDWQGPSVQVSTLEYEAGQARREVASFRQYASYSESFDDYADLLLGQSRYQPAVQQSEDSEAFFRALQHAGYATDPEYANKILAVMERDSFQNTVAGLKDITIGPLV